MCDEVRLSLRHGAQVGDIVPHDHVAECEVSSRAKGQVADNKPHCGNQAGCQTPSLPSVHPWPLLPPTSLTRCASMLMDNQEVGDPIGFASSH
jgi:hypothetical protein